jgi:VIT1/CCC1 family predicted Fe2+/Mn2+ transporter
LDHDLEPFTSPQERAQLYPAVLKRLLQLTPQRTRVKKEDVYGAIAVFCLVFLSAIPGVAPFLVLQDRFLALRVSNLLLLTILFLIGYRWARTTHMNPWVVGSVLLLAGLAMVSISMALGG